MQKMPTSPAKSVLSVLTSSLSSFPPSPLTFASLARSFSTSTLTRSESAFMSAENRSLRAAFFCSSEG